MRNLVFIFILFASCKSEYSNGFKANKAIRSYMKEKLNDYNSYVPVKTVIDSMFITEKGVKEFVGFEINHHYRAKNGFGAIMLDEIMFGSPPDLSIVNSLDDIKNETFSDF